jgi:cation transport protein ChaC
VAAAAVAALVHRAGASCAVIIMASTTPSPMDAPARPPAQHPPHRDPHHLLQHTRAQWGGRQDLWVFGYASLIWRPEFDADEHRPAFVHGYHRALRMRSRINRGTPQCPGLVFALLSGGSCRGIVYRIAQPRAHAELERLWEREMPTGVYDPRWLDCGTPHGRVRALGFTLSRRSPNYTGPIGDAELLRILRQAEGRYGSTLDYLVRTAQALRHHGIPDREIERVVALARRHGLAPA